MWALSTKTCSPPDTSSWHWSFLLRNKSRWSRHNMVCTNLLYGFVNIRTTKHAIIWLSWWVVMLWLAMSLPKKTRYARWQIIPKFEEVARKDTHFCYPYHDCEWKVVKFVMNTQKLLLQWWQVCWWGNILNWFFCKKLGRLSLFWCRHRNQSDVRIGWWTNMFLGSDNIVSIGICNNNFQDVWFV